jgi:hypothetical protein
MKLGNQHTLSLRVHLRCPEVRALIAHQLDGEDFRVTAPIAEPSQARIPLFGDSTLVRGTSSVTDHRTGIYRTVPIGGSVSPTY